MPESFQPVPLDDYLAGPGAAAPHLRRLFRADAPLLIFDIGACEGEEAIRYTRAFPAARVHSFEPLPANQSIIRANFARYGADRAELIPLALSDSTGFADFHVSSGRPEKLFGSENWNYGNKSSSLLPPASDTPMHGWITFQEKITVPTDTLDAYCARRGITRVDFLHIDVQGAEGAVLAGASRLLPQVGAIWVEVASSPLYAGQKTHDEIARFLRHHGFWLAVDARHDVEGDQLYVNLRRPAALRWWLGARLRPLRRLLGLLPR